MKNKVIDINEATIKQYVATLRPEDIEIRKQIDVNYSYDGKVIIIFQIRPDFMNPGEKNQLEFAKIRYYTTEVHPLTLKKSLITFTPDNSEEMSENRGKFKLRQTSLEFLLTIARNF